MRFVRLLALALLPVLLAACTTRDANLIDEHYDVADALAAQAKLNLVKNRPVLVAPFLQVNRLDEYSDFGSMAAEHMGSRLAQLGYTVLEVKLSREALYTLQDESGFLLSDELKNLSNSMDAQAVLLGTYASGKDNVYLSARLVRAADNVILAGEDYALPMGPDTEALIDDDTISGLTSTGRATWY